jgi:hypothetical protein
MKKYILYIAVILVSFGCSDDFLELYPKGYYHPKNYTPDQEIDATILAEGKLAQAYATLRGWPFQWAGLAMNNYTTPDAEKGSTPSDGGEVTQFKPLSYTSSNAPIRDYYTFAYGSIVLANEALVIANTLPDSVAKKKTYQAEAVFLRSVMYYRLNQAFGGVPYITNILGPNDKVPARLSRDELWSNIERDLLAVIPFLPTRLQLIASGNQGRATQNAARAILAKVYLYQKKWALALAQTSTIISSGDNDLTTPYTEIFTEAREYGPESVFEVYCEQKPVDQIFLSSQFGQIQGIRGIPNLGWGFNGPSQALMNAYEPGDPRKAATVIADGDTIEKSPQIVRVRADAAGYKFFNKKVYVSLAERGLYGRTADPQAYWMNIRVIRYADVLLMHAEAACELGNTTEALAKLEMVRERARAGNASLLPKITTTDIAELRAKIHHERRIELALEWERFYDLVRWDEAKDVIPNFVVGKHELFPIPQTEIDKSEGVLTQNPGY